MSGTHTPVRAGHVVGGRYRLRRERAAGAMGVVWEAEHVELGRAVAVKVMTEAAAAAPTAAARFDREARALSRVRHPHVVDVLDFGRLPSGAPFLVMELLEGETLADVLAREGRMAVADVCAWLRPIAAGLDAAHAAGVLHRDVKPANVVRATGDAGASAKLVDFGLAALDGEDEDGRLTGANTIVGTPAYLAPEAARGAAWSAASDVYALACVAYEMLTGAVPHARESVLGTLTARLLEPAPPISAVLGPSGPRGLDALFARALSADPGERPATASDLVRELVRIAEGRPSQRPAMVLPVVRHRATPRRPRRRSTGLWLALAATLGIVVYGLSLLSPEVSAWAGADDEAKTGVAIVAGPTVR